MAPEAGAQVTPNVRLTRLLGRGGMGSVWVADHLTLRTQVAVKFISEELSGDAEVLERFSREAMAAARIKSPHVVQVFDHGVFGGAPYIVMELLEGEDLAERLARAPLALGEMAFVLQQVGKALAQAHALGVVHRDIKPANVYLTRAGDDLHVKLLDFGIAKVKGGADPAHRTTQTGQVVGTPCYMSPEQVFSRGAVDLRADLWALAVLVYEAITGVLPFTGDTLGDIYLAINSASYRAPCALERSFPAELDGWFKRAFAVDPDARFASAREMVESFAAIAARAPDARRAARGEAAGAAQGTLAGTVSSAGRARSRAAFLVGAGIAVAGGLGLLLALRPRSGAAVGAGPSATAIAAERPPEPSAVAPSVTPAASAAPAVSAAVTPSASADAPAPSAPVAAPPAARPPAPPTGNRVTGPAPSGRATRRDYGF